MTSTVSSSLVDRFRSLLEAVKEGCARERRWRLLAGPMALLCWIRTRRERKEAAAAMEQIKTLLEEFVALLKEAAAAEASAAEGSAAQEGPPRLPSPTGAGEGVNGADRAAAPPSPQPSPIKGEGEEAGEERAAELLPQQNGEGQIAPLRSSASSAVDVSCRRETQRESAAIDVVVPKQWIPDLAGMTGLGGGFVAGVCGLFLKPDWDEGLTASISFRTRNYWFVGNTVLTIDASSAS